jgi:hypothetical protein
VPLSTALSGNVSIEEFRRAYLGEHKKLHRTKIKFKSGFVRTIHNLTPRKKIQLLTDRDNGKTLLLKHYRSTSDMEDKSHLLKSDKDLMKGRNSTRTSLKRTEKLDSGLLQYDF